MGASMYDECKQCYDNQMHKISTFLELDKGTEHRLKEIARDVVKDYDGMSNSPTAMARIWELIQPLTGTDDPYAQIKHDYNDLALTREDEIERTLASSDDPFQLALRFAAAGNLIDFGARHTFDETTFSTLLGEVPDISFSIDDSQALLERVRQAKTLLYIGDNCGEIVLDKVLVRQIRRENPDLIVRFGVRGAPIINDVTSIDAHQVGLDKIARIVSSGSAIPATDLSATSDEFNDVFFGSDVVICKGMGNYEALFDCERELFFLLMTKCEFVTEEIGAPLMSLVCLDHAGIARDVVAS